MLPRLEHALPFICRQTRCTVSQQKSKQKKEGAAYIRNFKPYINCSLRLNNATITFENGYAQAVRRSYRFHRHTSDLKQPRRSDVN